MRVTDKQRAVLQAVSTYVHPPTARRVCDRLETPEHDSEAFSYSEVYHHLVRLARKGALIRREDGDGGEGVRWEMTDAGREAMVP